MFTATMTSEEILREAQLDFYELKPRMEIAFGQFRRSYFSRRPDQPARTARYLTSSISETKQFKTRRHNLWTFEMYVNSYTEEHMYAGSMAFIPIHRSNGSVCYLFLRLRNVFDPELLTTHFLQRYKERYLEPNQINLQSMNAALYFERKSKDLQRTDFIPDDWTAEDLRTKQIWICSQGLVVTAEENGLRTFLTFLDQKNLSRYKALIYEEEELMRMYDRSKAAKNWFEQTLILMKMFNLPNSRAIQERYVRRTTDMSKPNAQEIVDKCMKAWDELERVTRILWGKIEGYSDKEREFVIKNMHPEIVEKTDVVELLLNRI